jgi:hypothetical protein
MASTCARCTRPCGLAATGVLTFGLGRRLVLRFGFLPLLPAPTATRGFPGGPHSREQARRTVAPHRTAVRHAARARADRGHGTAYSTRSTRRAPLVRGAHQSAFLLPLPPAACAFLCFGVAVAFAFRFAVRAAPQAHPSPRCALCHDGDGRTVGCGRALLLLRHACHWAALRRAVRVVQRHGLSAKGGGARRRVLATAALCRCRAAQTVGVRGSENGYG